jgi:DNA-binding transcriptional regulator YhcF (GntR family)
LPVDSAACRYTPAAHIVEGVIARGNRYCQILIQLAFQIVKRQLKVDGAVEVVEELAPAAEDL